jgi:imidazolonepropionase
MYPTTNLLFFNPLFPPKHVQTILYNSGPVLHFNSDSEGLIEEEIYTYPKAIIIANGVIEKIEDSSIVVEEYGIIEGECFNDSVKVVDLGGNAVVPGLIDPHTHLLWEGDRSREVRWRREGLSYAQIAELGGGIQHTVHATRGASSERLFELGYLRLRESLRTGTTHLEAKSGYGLSVDHELRLLEIANKLRGIQHLPTLDLTWMGAHDIPKETTRQEYVESLLSQQLPAVLEQGFARSVDVFCEPGWFTLEDAEEILRTSQQAGLATRMHVDEFIDGGGGNLAAELGVATADHAYHTPLASRLRMKDADVMTGFLPGTPYAMGDAWPDMKLMEDHQIPFTLATDFNPNCRTLSLPFMCSLMVQRCNVHPIEALRAVTVNAAKTTPHPSGKIHGQLKEGAVANLNIVDGPHWEAVALRPSGTPFKATVLNGQFIAH